MISAHTCISRMMECAMGLATFLLALHLTSCLQRSSKTDSSQLSSWNWLSMKLSCFEVNGYTGQPVWTSFTGQIQFHALNWIQLCGANYGTALSARDSLSAGARLRSCSCSAWSPNKIQTLPWPIFLTRLRCACLSCKAGKLFNISLALMPQAMITLAGNVVNVRVKKSGRTCFACKLICFYFIPIICKLVNFVAHSNSKWALGQSFPEFDSVCCLTTLSFKQVSLVSLANCQGGIILGGVGGKELRRQVRGMILSEKEKEQFKKLMNRACSQIYPALRTSFKQVQTEFVPVTINGRQSRGQFVLRVRVRPSHCFHCLKGPHRNYFFYRRLQNSDQQITNFQAICKAILSRKTQSHLETHTCQELSSPGLPLFTVVSKVRLWKGRRGRSQKSRVRLLRNLRD